MGLRAYAIFLLVGIIIGAGGTFYFTQGPGVTGFSLQPLLDSAKGMEIPDIPVEIPGGTGTAANDAQITAYFCPQDNCATRLESVYDGAQSEIHVMAYSFTREDLADALVDAAARGVAVRVVMDHTQAANKYAVDEYLAERGIPVKVVDLPGWHIMHHKVSVVDGRTVTTGSFNYTNNADRGNAENLVVIKDPALADAYEQEFQKYWNYEAT